MGVDRQSQRSRELIIAARHAADDGHRLPASALPERVLATDGVLRAMVPVERVHSLDALVNAECLEREAPLVE